MGVVKMFAISAASGLIRNVVVLFLVAVFELVAFGSHSTVRRASTHSVDYGLSLCGRYLSQR